MRFWSVQVDYDGRCALLGLESLKQRNYNAQRLFVAGLLDNRVQILLSGLNFYVPSRSLRSRLMLNVEGRRRRFGDSDPFLRMCRAFNVVCYRHHLTCRAPRL